MPRICKSDGEPLDFCFRCFPSTEENARLVYAGTGTGPDGRGDCFAFQAEHPDYDGDDFRCHRCKSPLFEMDN